jgi:hypothetical protein
MELLSPAASPLDVRCSILDVPPPASLLPGYASLCQLPPLFGLAGQKQASWTGKLNQKMNHPLTYDLPAKTGRAGQLGLAGPRNHQMRSNMTITIKNH